MAHSRNRLVDALVWSTLEWSPVVGVFGLRQVGKTTLVEKITKKKGGTYETFDRETPLQISKEKPVQFLSHPQLFCIDEAQKAPWIFPVIKDLVGTKRKPGQFLLTGSVRFTLKKDIQESLTGRIVTHELLPFTVSEAHQKAPSVFLEKVFDMVSTTKGQLHTKYLLLESLVNSLRHTTPQSLGQHLMLGGLPVPCFSRDAQKRKFWFESYYETLLGRDILLVEPSLKSVSFSQGMAFLKELALFQGEDISLSRLCSKSTMRLSKGKDFLLALEALALVDLVPPEIRTEKSMRKPKVEWKDVGLWSFLSQQSGETIIHNSQAVSLLLACEFRNQKQMLKHKMEWSYFKSREGSLIPWIFKMNAKTIVINYLALENPTAYDFRTLKKIVSETKNSLGIVLGPEKTKPFVLDEKIILLPWTLVF
jgi:predicted AAA+ superfamily ATPase